MSRQASPVVWGAVVDLEALVVKLQADCLLEHGLEGAVAAYDCLTTAIAGTRERIGAVSAMVGRVRWSHP
jgi:hypothetical protein